MLNNLQYVVMYKQRDKQKATKCLIREVCHQQSDNEVEKVQSLCSGPPLSHLNIFMHHVDSNTVLRADVYEFRHLLPQIEGSTLLQLAIISCSLIKPETNLRLTNSTGNAYVVCLDFDLAGLKERIGDWKTSDREPPHR